MVNVSLLRTIAGLNLTLAVSLWGCQSSPPSRPLTISAASSLKEVLEDIEPRFESIYPHIDLNFNFAASGVLQHQIEQGAPVDIFFPAATQPMDSLVHKQLVTPNSRRAMVTNDLVLIVSVESDLALNSFQQLPAPNIRKIMVGEFTSVPAGQYAQEVFSTLNLHQRLQPKLVFAQNVRGVLAAVANTNVDAGIVYGTDAQRSDQVKKVATAPADSHSSIVYPIGVVAASSQPEAAQTFIDFLSRSETQETLTEFGFGVVIEE